MLGQLNYYVIDSRALQQHFNKVRQREQPPKQIAPRISDLKPLTAVQVIVPVQEPQQIIEPIQPIVDTSELQKELLEVTQAHTTLKQSLTQTPQIEPVTITVPVSVATIVTEIKETKEEPIEEESPYGYSVLEKQSETDDYNPYGYYSGPLF